MFRPNRDVTVWESVIEPPLLAALAQAMREGKGRPAEVRAPTGHQVDPKVRRTSSVGVPPSVSDPVRLRLERLRGACEERFGLPLGRCEAPQFLRYEHGDRFVPHADVTPQEIRSAVVRRRVTVVLHVAQEAPAIPPRGERPNVPREATASRGCLTFFDTSADVTWQTCRVRIAVAAGSVITFPSEMIHEVPPVRASHRLTVVTWFWDRSEQ
ncbi:2OG-Fe(II) oxygenase [Streptomyces syringium]|uniref:2OG-Fe(II) oxygenase n=1 Tax=Streptomyces syringium TaxID=76729 RepID=UPI00342D8774